MRRSMIAPSASSSGGRLPRRRRRRRSGERRRWRSFARRPWRALVSSTGPRGRGRRFGSVAFLVPPFLVVAAHVVDNGSGMFLVLLVTFFSALCFLRSSTGLRCLASWPVWTRRTVAVVCTRLVLLVTMLLALCSFPWLAGPESSAFWPVWTRRTVAVAWTMLVLLVILHLALFLPFVRPMMLGILASMLRKDSCPRRSGHWIFLEMTWSCSTAPYIWKSLVRAVCLRSTCCFFSWR